MAIADAAFEDGCARQPETWSDAYFQNQPSSLSAWWRRESWVRSLELEPRLSSNELWELTEAVWVHKPHRVLGPRAMAEYVMGLALPPMEYQDDGEGTDGLGRE